MSDNRNLKVAICGVGGVGSWAAETLAKAARGQEGLISKIGLFDPDVLEQKNLARMPTVSPDWVGHPKVDLIRRLIQGTVANVERRQIKVDASNIDMILFDYDIVICCSDDVENQRLVKLWCDRNRSKVYQRAGYDGDNINVCRALPMTFDVEEEKADAGYHGQPEVYQAMLAGCLAVYSVLKNTVTVMGEVKKIGCLDATHVPESVREAIVASVPRQIVSAEAEDWEEIASNHGWHDSDNCNHDECYPSFSEQVSNNPGNAYDTLRGYHDRSHVARSRTDDDCPYCQLATVAAAEDE